MTDYCLLGRGENGASVANSLVCAVMHAVVRPSVPFRPTAPRNDSAALLRETRYRQIC